MKIHNGIISPSASVILLNSAAILLNTFIDVLSVIFLPSSWFTSVRSAQSEGLVPQLGSGTFTRKPVSCCESNTVKRSLGNGDVVVDCRLKSGCVCASASAGGAPALGETGSPGTRTAVRAAQIRTADAFTLPGADAVAAAPPESVAVAVRRLRLV